MTWRRAVLLLVTTAMAVVVAEAAVRVIDGYALLSLSLERKQVPQATGTPDRKYLPASLAAGVRPEWYELDPPEIPRVPMTPEIAARAASHRDDPYGAFYMWNSAYVRESLCRGLRSGSFGTLDAFYTFDPADGKTHPIYRHIPHINPPQWFTPNNFGWRGPDLTSARPADTIRIAFVGASTTSDAYGVKFSHPELVGHWLNLWTKATGKPYRIQVINAGRTGVDSSTIAAVVRTELLSVDPDLVLFYEGANDFAAATMLDAPRQLPARPEATFRKRSRAEDYSAIAVRVYDALLKAGQDGGEPQKPDYPLRWPSGVDEQNPDLSRPLPMHFERVVQNLDAMREAVTSTGGELAVASFVWMVDPGLRLDMVRHLTLFRYLNETYWPVTYAQMRRLADFQNRTFRTYARQHHLVYVPMDETYPRDPDLFDDGVHMNARGLRLRAWFYLQQLVPIIQARVEAHKWPRPPSANLPPADWASKPPKLVSRETFLASCPAPAQ